MRIALTVISLLLAATLAGCDRGRDADDVQTAEPAATVAPAAEGDLFLGEYVKNETFGGQTGELLAQVYPLGERRYAATLLGDATCVAGLVEGQDFERVELEGLAVGPVLRLWGREGLTELAGRIQGETMALEVRCGDRPVVRHVLTRAVRRSPTAGAEPPAGATVLLALTAGQVELENAWRSTSWTTLDGGVVEVGEGDLRSRAELGSGSYHVEFMTPLEPSDQGQGRGNSGVYVQDRYEVQVLDSFGLRPLGGDCGAIYGLAAPAVNASLPPGVWQTYDIEFTAAEFDADGAVVADPRMTVRHNGVLIHDDVVLGHVTGGAVGRNHVPAAPLRLQDHGDAVRYRNIWFVPAH